MTNALLTAARLLVCKRVLFAREPIDIESKVEARANMMGEII